MTTNNNKLSDILNEGQIISENVRIEFGKLTPFQINWKPNHDKWSIGQCLNHINITNTYYFPVFEKIIKAERVQTMWEKINPFSNLLGKYLTKSIEPGNVKKYNAPSIFKPSNSNIDKKVIEDFITNQSILLEFVKKIYTLNFLETIITSPVAKLFTYNLSDCINILINHEQRHIQQAKRIKLTENFPKE